MRQSKTNPATAGSTTNTLQVMMMRIMSMTMVIVLSGPVAGYDLDIVPPPESTELRKLGSRQTSTAAEITPGPVITPRPASENSRPPPIRMPCEVVMLSLIAIAVDLSQSVSFLPIDVAMLEGMLGSLRKVFEVGLAHKVQVQELDYLHGECCLALGKIGGDDHLGLRWGWSLEGNYWRLRGSWWNLDRYLWWRVLRMNDRGGRLDGNRYRWRLLARWERRRRLFWGNLGRYYRWRLGVWGALVGRRGYDGRRHRESLGRYDSRCARQGRRTWGRTWGLPEGRRGHWGRTSRRWWGLR